MLLFYVIAALFGTVIDGLASMTGIRLPLLGWTKVRMGFEKRVRLSDRSTMTAHVIEYAPGRWAVALVDGVPLNSNFGTISFAIEVSMALDQLKRAAALKSKPIGTPWITEHLARLAQGSDSPDLMVC